MKKFTLLLFITLTIISCKKKDTSSPAAPTPTPTPAPTPTPTYSVGESYQGGKIAYVFQNGDPGYISGEKHGLIVATTNQSNSIAWYAGLGFPSGATDTIIGTGNANTNKIVGFQGAGSYAARLCYDLVIDSYSDWYLPSKNELNKILLNASTIGGINGGAYWSSSEFSVTQAWRNIYPGNFENCYQKDYSGGSVRAIRTF